MRVTPKLRQQLADLEAHASDGETTDALGESADALTAGIALLDAPGETAAPEPTALEDAGPSNEVYGHGATSTFTAVRGGASTDFSASLDGGMASLSASHTQTGRSRGVDAVLYQDYVSLDASATVATPEGAKSRDVTLEATSGSLALGGGGSVGRGDRTAGLWGSGSVSADRSVTDLGPDARGGRRVELSSSRGGGLWSALGLVTGALGLGGTLSHDRSREVTFRTALGDEPARDALFEGGGVLGALRDKARALGLLPELLQVPELSKPAAMKVGDELTVSVTGTLTGGFALRTGVVRAGAQAVVEGRFELAAKKISDTQLELTVTPRQVRGVQCFVDSLTPVMLDAARLNGSALRQGFIFNLEKPDARTAYAAALEGKLPSALAKLPRGVQRTFAEDVRSRLDTAGLGLELGPIASGGFAGLSAHRVAVSERRTLSSGRVGLQDDTRAVTHRRELLLSGTESTGIFTALRHRGRALEAVTLRAHFEDTCVVGTELNHDVVDRLNGALGLSLARFERGGRRRSRSVDVALTLEPRALTALAERREGAVRAAAKAAGAPGDDAWALVQRLAASGVEALQAYVLAGGLPAIGTVHRLLGEELDGFELTSEAGAYADVADAVQALAFEYHRPMEPGDEAAALVRRFGRVEKQLREVREARADAAADPLLEAGERAEVLAGLDAAAAQLHALLSCERFSPEDAEALRQQLGAGAVQSRLVELVRATR